MGAGGKCNGRGAGFLLPIHSFIPLFFSSSLRVSL